MSLPIEAKQAAVEQILATAEAFEMEGHDSAQSQGHANAEQILARRLQAWDLRIAGLSYRQIAKRSGVSLALAYDDVQSAAELIEEHRKAKAERTFEIELERNDKVRHRMQRDATNAANTVAERAKAGAAFARLSDIRNRMLGINAPEKVLHAGMVLTEQQLASSRSSLDEKLEQLRARMVGGAVAVVVEPAQVTESSARALTPVVAST